MSYTKEFAMFRIKLVFESAVCCGLGLYFSVSSSENAYDL